MLDFLASPWALAAAIYLWAGYWLARPCITVSSKQPTWARITTFFFLALPWAIVFPISQLAAERKARLANRGPWKQ